MALALRARGRGRVAGRPRPGRRPARRGHRRGPGCCRVGRGRYPGPAGDPADLAVLAVPPAAVAPAPWPAPRPRPGPLVHRRGQREGLPAGRRPGRSAAIWPRFVPGHPLSGRERSGPAAARADLFLGRPWVICPAAENPEAGRGRGGRAGPGLRRRAGPGQRGRARPAGSRWSRTRRTWCPRPWPPGWPRPADGALALAGQGLRDVTRIAAGDSGLWTQILAANAAPVAEVLAAVAADLAAAAEALARWRRAERPGRAGPDRRAEGAGRAAGPGLGRGRPDPRQAGRPARADAMVQVVIPDQPGELARLFQAAGEAGVNIEDIGIEHSPGLPVGVAELTVRPDAVDPLDRGTRGQWMASSPVASPS